MAKKIKFMLHWEYNGSDVITVDLVNPPENLEELVTVAFRSYTEGTRKDYRDEDKLRFIDLLRKRINPTDFDSYYEQYAHGQLDYAIENDGEFNLEDDVDSSVEFAESCFDEGFKPLAFTGNEMNHHDRDKAVNTIARIVKAVMNYNE